MTTSRQVTSRGPDGEAVTRTVTETRMETRTVTEHVPDPPKPRKPEPEPEPKPEPRPEPKPESKPDTDRTDGAATDAAYRRYMHGHDPDWRPEPPKITAQEAQDRLAGLRQEMKAAEKPADLRKIADEANKLDGLLTQNVSYGREGLSDINDQSTKFSDKLNAAVTAMDNLDAAHKALKGEDPAARAAAAAKLLAHPEEFEQDLQALGKVGGPAVGAYAEKVEGILKEATPATIAEGLEANPFINEYPAGFGKDLAALPEIPELEGPIARSADLAVSGAASIDDLSADQVAVAAAAALDSDTVRSDLSKLVQADVDKMVDARLDAAHGEDELKRAIDGIMKDAERMVGEHPGLGELIAKATENKLTASKDRMNDIANEGKNVFQKIGDFFGGMWDGVKGGLGKLAEIGSAGVGFVTGKATQALEWTGHAAGAVTGTAARLAGAANGFLTEHAGKALAFGLDKAGADGAARFVSDKSAALATFQRDYGAALGDSLQSFGDGLGKGLGGITSGVGFLIQHPVQSVKGLADMVSHLPGVTDPKALMSAGAAALQGKNPMEALAKDFKGDMEYWKGVGTALFDEGFRDKSGKIDVAQGGGYVAGNLLPILLTGGGAAATKGAQAAKAADTAADAAKVADVLSDGARAADVAADASTGVRAIQDVKHVAKAGADDLAKAVKNPELGLSDYAGIAKGTAREAGGRVKEFFGDVRSVPDEFKNSFGAWKSKVGEAFGKENLGQEWQAFRDGLKGDALKENLRDISTEVVTKPGQALDHVRSALKTILPDDSKLAEVAGKGDLKKAIQKTARAVNAPDDFVIQTIFDKSAGKVLTDHQMVVLKTTLRELGVIEEARNPELVMDAGEKEKVPAGPPPGRFHRAE